MINQGKYDDVCSVVREGTQAEGAMLIILNGEFGSGFSAQLPMDFMKKIPGVLRSMANHIEKEHAIA